MATRGRNRVAVKVLRTHQSDDDKKRRKLRKVGADESCLQWLFTINIRTSSMKPCFGPLASTTTYFRSLVWILTTSSTGCVWSCHGWSTARSCVNSGIWEKGATKEVVRNRWTHGWVFPGKKLLQVPIENVATVDSSNCRRFGVLTFSWYYTWWYEGREWWAALLTDLADNWEFLGQRPPRWKLQHQTIGFRSLFDSRQHCYTGYHCGKNT